MTPPIYVSDDGPERELPKAGLVNAVCCYIEDIGYQKTPWGEKRQLIVGFEIAQRISQEGDYKDKRFVLSNTYTASLNEKANLRHDLEGWLGRSLSAQEVKQFDISTLRAKPATVTIRHKTNEASGKTYANIVAVAPLMEGAEAMTVELEKVPDWVAEKKQAGTAGGMVKPAIQPDDDLDSVVPF